VAGNSALPSSPPLSNADIADRLASLAQLLSTQKENPYKVKAYRRAAAKVRTLSESVDELVRDGSDLTEFSGIGAAISGAIREIVLTGTLGKLEKLRSQASPELASINTHPRLDPKRVLRIYKKLHISSVEALREQLENGEIEKKLGLRMAQHVRQGLTEAHAMLLHKADDLRAAVESSQKVPSPRKPPYTGNSGWFSSSPSFARVMTRGNKRRNAPSPSC
jgi:DNA polymerase (family 10)